MDAGDFASIGCRDTPGRDSGNNLPDCRPTGYGENPFDKTAGVAGAPLAIGDNLGMLAGAGKGGGGSFAASPRPSGDGGTIRRTPRRGFTDGDMLGSRPALGTGDIAVCRITLECMGYMYVLASGQPVDAAPIAARPTCCGDIHRRGCPPRAPIPAPTVRTPASGAVLSAETRQPGRSCEVGCVSEPALLTAARAGVGRGRGVVDTKLGGT